MKSAYTKSKSGGFIMKLVKKIKLTYQYYKSLGKKKKPQSSSDLNIRSDVYAFCHSRNRLYPAKKEMHQIKYINKSIIIT